MTPSQSRVVPALVAATLLLPAAAALGVLNAQVTIGVPDFMLRSATHVVQGSVKLGPSLPGIVVELVMDGQVAATATTDNGGKYRFLVDASALSRGQHVAKTRVASPGITGESRAVQFIAADAPGAPTGLAASSVALANAVALSWNAPADDGGATILGYAIYRADNAAGPSVVVAVTAGGAAAKTVLVNNASTNTYWAAAITGAAEGPKGEPVDYVAPPTPVADALTLTAAGYEVCTHYACYIVPDGGTLTVDEPVRRFWTPVTGAVSSGGSPLWNVDVELQVNHSWSPGLCAPVCPADGYEVIASVAKSTQTGGYSSTTGVFQWTFFNTACVPVSSTLDAVYSGLSATKSVSATLCYDPDS